MIEPLNFESRLLLGPGPSEVHRQVLEVMGKPLIGHLDPQFIQIMDEVKEMTRMVFETDNALTSVISATGSGGMETCFVNLLEPGDEAVVCVNGVFGHRMCDIAERCGAQVRRIEAPWGEPIAPHQVKKALIGSRPKIVAIVHGETSTGVLQPLVEIGQLVREAGSLLVVDAVTSLAGTALKMDGWHIDACYSGTQKCLSAPPGLSPVSFSPAAVAVMEARKTKVQSWYLDMSLIRQYWSGIKRSYHHTAPISMIYGIHEALRLVLEEGLEKRYARHEANHVILREGLEALGFRFVVAPAYRLPMLNAVRIPPEFDDRAMRNRLLQEYHIEVGSGLGEFAGKIWRIGLMGESSNAAYVDRLLSALKEIMG